MQSTDDPPNPFSRQFWNLTERGQIFKRDKDRADRLARAAGHRDALSARIARRNNGERAGSGISARRRTQVSLEYERNTPAVPMPPVMAAATGDQKDKTK